MAGSIFAFDVFLSVVRVCQSCHSICQQGVQLPPRHLSKPRFCACSPVFLARSCYVTEVFLARPCYSEWGFVPRLFINWDSSYTRLTNIRLEIIFWKDFCCWRLITQVQISRYQWRKCSSFKSLCMPRSPPSSQILSRADDVWGVSQSASDPLN